MTAPNKLPEEPRRYMVVFRPVSMSRASGEADMEPSETGGWVKLSDYDAKARECEEFEAKIDRLMMEYCPEEMTQAQIDNWAKNQRPVDAEREATIDAARSEGEK